MPQDLSTNTAFIIVDKSIPSLEKLLSWLQKSHYQLRICSCTDKGNPNAETTSLQHLALYVGMIEH